MSVLQGVKNAILILSGKGGVGKSTTSVQLATSLALLGYKVGILDVDLCGPSIPKMMGIQSADITAAADGSWIPIYSESGSCYVMSMNFFLENKNDAVVWRGPKKNAMIKQLLTKVKWDVDYLIIDTPPGTSDEHISVMENIREASVLGAVLVTTPQMVSVDDVTREITFCQKTGIHILGIVENMSGFVCPHCADCTNIMATGGGEVLSEKYSIAFLGRIPIDPNLVQCLEEGRNFLKHFADSPACKMYREVALKLIS